MIACTPARPASPSRPSLNPSRLSISSWLRMRLEPPSPFASGASAAAAAWAAGAASDDGGGAAVVDSGLSLVGSATLLHQHFFEQYVLDLRVLRRGDHARQQLFAQPVHTGRAAQIVQSQLAQIDLEAVDDARLHCLELGDVGFTADFETDRDFQEIGPPPGAVEIHQELRQVIEDRLLRLLGRLVLGGRSSFYAVSDETKQVSADAA